MQFGSLCCLFCFLVLWTLQQLLWVCVLVCVDVFYALAINCFQILLSNRFGQFILCSYFAFFLCFVLFMYNVHVHTYVCSCVYFLVTHTHTHTYPDPVRGEYISVRLFGLNLLHV